MKKLTALILSTLMAFSLASCGVTNNTAKTDAAPTTEQNSTKAPENSTDDNGTKALVVYYSASGNTKAVAQTIAETAKADTFELVPVDIYSDDDLDWTDSDSRVSREHDNPDKRDVPLEQTTVDNWDKYDTVFIGYPIWWGIAAWPVDTFVKANDFSGKTVIPFCTSSSSGMGKSGELLAEMAGTGEWQEGMRFRSGAAEDTIISWVEGLSY